MQIFSVSNVLQFVELDAKPDDLTICRLKTRGNFSLTDRTLVCCTILRRHLVRSEKLIEFGDISFSAKSILVERTCGCKAGKVLKKKRLIS